MARVRYLVSVYPTNRTFNCVKREINFKNLEIAFRLQAVNPCFQCYVSSCHMLLSICCSRTYYANATCQTLTRKFFFTFSSNYLISETFENCTYFLYVYKWYIVPKRLTLVSNAKRKISKSNKSKLWNRLSYRSLSYFFEVCSQTFRNDCKRACSTWKPSIFNLIRLDDGTTIWPSRRLMVQCLFW